MPPLIQTPHSERLDFWQPLQSSQGIIGCVRLLKHVEDDDEPFTCRGVRHGVDQILLYHQYQYNGTISSHSVQV